MSIIFRDNFENSFKKRTFTKNRRCPWNGYVLYLEPKVGVLLPQSHSSIKIFWPTIKKLVRNFEGSQGQFLRNFQISMIRRFLIKETECRVCTQINMCGFGTCMHLLKGDWLIKNRFKDHAVLAVYSGSAVVAASPGGGTGADVLPTCSFLLIYHLCPLPNSSAYCLLPSPWVSAYAYRGFATG